jgi:hypothetical protein
LTAAYLRTRGFPHRAAAATDPREAPRGGAYILSVLGDEHWRATVVQRAYDSLVASVEQMRCALDLCQETNAILNEIKKTLHAQVRGQVGTFLWLEADEFVQAKPGGLTVLQVLCERERARVFNQTDDEPPPYFVDAIQDFMIARDGRTPARKVRKTARNAWKEDPGADRRVSRDGTPAGSEVPSPLQRSSGDIRSWRGLGLC